MLGRISSFFGPLSTTSKQTTTTFDSDAQAFFTASGLTGTTNLNAINQLVLDLKGYGIWTKMKAIYPFIGGTAALHKWNLKDPRDLNAAFRLVFNGGWTHSATGALPNGTNGYADTFLNPIISSTNHLSFYSRTLAVGIQIEMGCWDGLGAAMSQIRPAVNYVSGNPGTTVMNFTTTTDARGFWLGSRRATNDREVYRNGVSEAVTTTNDTTALPNFKIYIGARNSANNNVELYSNKECAFASIGDGLTDTEAANFYTAVQAYQTTLSRNV